MQKPETAREIVFTIPERYKTDKADPNYETVVHLILSGDRGGNFTVSVTDGKATVAEGLTGEPKCIVETKDETYEEIEWGKTNAQMAYMFGKIKVSDIGELLDFTPLFHRLENFYK